MIKQMIIETIIVYIVIFLFNYIFFVKKNKKFDENNMPVELLYLTIKYKINPKAINFKKFQYTYSLLNAFIITSTYILVTYLLKTMIMRIIMGIIILSLEIIICYGLLAKYYLYKEEKNKK